MLSFKLDTPLMRREKKTMSDGKDQLAVVIHNCEERAAIHRLQLDDMFQVQLRLLSIQSI
jgi:hypothetical protein